MGRETDTVGRAGRIWLSALLGVAMVAAQVPSYLDGPARVAVAANGSIAYVYDTDTAGRDAFVSYFTARGYATDTFTVAGTASANFGPYVAIVIGNDTGSLSSWGTPTAVSNIAGANKPIIGVGEGGYAFFGRKYNGAANTIGWANGAHGSGSSLAVLNAADPVWSTPNAITTTTGATVSLYAATTGVVGIYDPNRDKGFHIIGTDPAAPAYDNVVGQGRCDLLWGYGGSPGAMTALAQDLFANVLVALSASCPKPTISGHVTFNGGVSGAIVRIDNAAGGAVVATGTTDANGYYSLAVPAGNNYDVTVTAAGFPVQVYSGAVSTAGATAVAVGTADVTGIDFQLVAGYAVSGRVTDVSGASQSGVEVDAYLGTPNVCCYFIRGTRTNSDGSYSMVLAPGYDYKVRFAANTANEQWWNGAANPGNDTFTGWSAAQSFRVSSPASCGGSVTDVFNNWDRGGVTNGGTPPTFSTPGAGAYCVVEIDTYHWNNGTGATPGRIQIKDSAGSLVVDAPAFGSPGANNAPNENWYVQFASGSQPVIQGTYSCDDSDHATWSYDAAVSTFGFCRVQGLTATPGTTGHPNTNAVLAGAITGVARCGSAIGTSVVLRSGSVVVDQQAGLVNGAFRFVGTAPNATYGLDYTVATTLSGPPALFAGPPPPPPPPTCSVVVTTDASGNATAPGGSLITDLKNHTWTSAFRLDPQAGGTPSITKFGQIDYVAVSGRSDWYVVHVAPGQRILVKLTGTSGTALPADLSLALFKDIRAYLTAKQSALSQDPLQTIRNNDASTAPDALSPDALSPDALSPDALSPDALSPDALSPDALSPDALSPDELSPDELSPDALSPDALSPDALSPDELSPDAYSGAQTATILRISAHAGTSPEQIIQNTWSNTGDFYIRVRGHNGAYSASAGFQLTVEETSTACTGVVLQPYAATPGPAATPSTVILTNSARFGGVAANYGDKLTAFAARPEVNGLVLDLATNTGLAPAYAQWDANKTCPAAANVVADAIKALVDQYRPSVRYVVLAGGDNVIPYFRTPDQAGLGIESGFNPGLFQDTPSEASLQFGYTLTQDSYGTKSPIAHFDHSFFMPDLPVGRLVESSTDIIAVLDAYSAANGVVHVAGGHAVDSGYDFLSDTATFIQTSLAPSLTVDPLIQLRGQPAWTADQLRAKLFAQHNDIVALNGHFSANTLLASDFATRMTTDEIGQFMSLFTNALVISSGCHSGYNIVDPDALPTTKSLDWVQTLARAGAETIGSTGYAYGDTDFMKYTELILGNFTTELRYDSGPIAIGQALVNAKRAYVASLPALRGIDEKALMEATLYGLPMWSVDLGTNGRLVRPSNASGITPAPVTGVSGLSSATVTPTYTLNRHPASGNGDAGAYYDANGNLAVAPAAPVLPLTSQDVAVAGSNARGAVLMDATYLDEANVTPFTDVAGTDLAGMHPGYASPVFSPVRPFALNSLSGTTSFVTTPAQYKTTTANSGTLRRWTSQSVQLFYSSRTDAAAAFAGAPIVYSVNVTPGTGSAVRFSATVGALTDPGFAGAYLTYTAEQGSQYGTWHSVPMTQVGSDLATGPVGITRTYAAEITPGTGATAGDLRAFVQIVGGNGLVSMSTNNGEYYKLVPETATTAAPKQTTALTISAPASAAYLSSATVTATLTGGGSGLAGLPVTLTLGTQHADVVTGAGGVATVTFTLNTAPGATTAGASFAEDTTHLATSATAAFTITPAAPSLTGAPATIQYSDSAVIATLHLGGGSDPQSITLAANGVTIAGQSDPLGRIRLDTRDLPLTPGINSVVVSFAGNDRFTAASTTVQVTQTAEDATLTVPSYAPQPVGTLPVSAQVAQAQDGSLGDLTKAKVTFALRNESGVLVGTQIDASVGSSGASSAAFANVVAGLYHVEATVSGGYFSSPLVSSIAVVYDSSTFVTGGGWVLTTSDSTGLVAGKKANFGFNAKYLTGTTIPTGSVEFSAKESNVNFKATGFDWLVISSGRAELQGTGTLNGAGSYSFRLVAVDGSPDSFAIRVWNATTSYDLPLYQVSAPLGSGNIVVH